MKINNLRFLGTGLFLFILLFTSQSCKQVAKYGVKKIAKKVIGKTARVAGTAALILSVEEVIAQDLLDEFDNKPPNQQPVNISIYNRNSTYVTVFVTKDGKYWQEQSIQPNQYLNYKSSRKGLVGVKSGEKMFLLRESKKFELRGSGSTHTIQEM